MHVAITVVVVNLTCASLLAALSTGLLWGKRLRTMGEPVPPT
jgi:hypothetical protein